MAEKLERKVMEVYGEKAATRDIIAYGSDIAGNIVETKDPDVIQTEAYKTGVRSAVVGNNSTTLQNRQALDFLFSRQLKYLYQHGIAEWGASETYFVNSLAVGSDGNLYVSLTDNNTGNDPTTDTTNWQAFPTPAHLAQKVAKAGDTMTGALKMSGENQIRFGTDDNYFNIQFADNGQLAIFNKNNKGLFLQTEDPHAPFYFDGTEGRRLLTTADLPGNAGSTIQSAVNYSAQVSITSPFTCPTGGAIGFRCARSDSTTLFLKINEIMVFQRDGGEFSGASQSMFATVSAGDVISWVGAPYATFFWPAK